MRRFLLARIGKPIAVMASEQPPDAMQLGAVRPQYIPFETTEHTNMAALHRNDTASIRW
jgi:hypothetical protein